MSIDQGHDPNFLVMLISPVFIIFVFVYLAGIYGIFNKQIWGPLLIILTVIIDFIIVLGLSSESDFKYGAITGDIIILVLATNLAYKWSERNQIKLADK